MEFIYTALVQLQEPQAHYNGMATIDRNRGDKNKFKQIER